MKEENKPVSKKRGRPRKVVTTEENKPVEEQSIKDEAIPQKPKKIASIRRIKGLKLYEFNFSTGDLSEVLIGENKRVEFNKECFYCQALNVKNAIKKINRKLKEIKNG